MEKKVEKVVLKKMMSLPANKVLLLEDLQIPLKNMLGLQWEDSLQHLESVLSRLDKKEVIRLDEARSGHYRLFKGINFEDYTAPPQSQGTPINIGSFHNNGSAQFGDNNVSNIQLIQSIEQLLTKIDNSEATPQEKKAAKEQIKAIFDNPTISSVLGGVAGSLFELF